MYFTHSEGERDKKKPRAVDPISRPIRYYDFFRVCVCSASCRCQMLIENERASTTHFLSDESYKLLTETERKKNRQIVNRIKAIFLWRCLSHV